MVIGFRRRVGFRMNAGLLRGGVGLLGGRNRAYVLSRVCLSTRTKVGVQLEESEEPVQQNGAGQTEGEDLDDGPRGGKLKLKKKPKSNLWSPPNWVDKNSKTFKAGMQYENVPPKLFKTTKNSILLVDAFPIFYSLYYGKLNRWKRIWEKRQAQKADDGDSQEVFGVEGLKDDEKAELCKDVVHGVETRIHSYVNILNPEYIAIVFDGKKSSSTRKKAIKHAKALADLEYQRLRGEIEHEIQQQVEHAIAEEFKQIGMVYDVNYDVVRAFEQLLEDGEATAADAQAQVAEALEPELVSVMDDMEKHVLDTGSIIDQMLESDEFYHEIQKRLVTLAKWQTIVDRTSNEDLEKYGISRERMLSGLQELFVELNNARLTIVEKVKPRLVEHCGESFQKLAALDEEFSPMIEFPEYKGHRPAPPPLMVDILPTILEKLEPFNVLNIENFEADDVIGTLARTSTQKHNLDVTIVSPDKDFFQLIDHRTVILQDVASGSRRKLRCCDFNWFKSQYSVEPSKHVDILSLIGDKADNLPGVASVGQKRALDLIQKHGSVESLIQHSLARVADKETEPSSMDKNVAKAAQKTLLCKHLIRIDSNVDVGVEIESLVNPNQLRLGSSWCRKTQKHVKKFY
mmetsp:Transcript_20734/g.33783  ORF Transcript_20734/g.33783 Transcript_20734/m.33783 type:complete len:629 (+) Transcript_20734:259-2145(+)